MFLISFTLVFIYSWTQDGVSSLSSSSCSSSCKPWRVVFFFLWLFFFNYLFNCLIFFENFIECIFLILSWISSSLSKYSSSLGTSRNCFVRRLSFPSGRFVLRRLTYFAVGLLIYNYSVPFWRVSEYRLDIRFGISPLN